MNIQSDIEIRVRRLEWQNRLLITAFCVATALASVAATKLSSGTVISADEVRANKLVLLDKEGNQSYYWQGLPRGGYDKNGQVYTIAKLFPWSK